MVPLAAPILACVLLAGPEPPSRETPERPPAREPAHRFWDGTNAALFIGVGGSRMLDYASTRHFRARGFNEVLLTNDIVDEKPLFLGIELAGTALSIGASALLHHYGHHKLERWLSAVHIGITTYGAARNFDLHRTRAGAPAGR